MVAASVLPSSSFIGSVNEPDKRSTEIYNELVLESIFPTGGGAPAKLQKND